MALISAFPGQSGAHRRTLAALLSAGPMSLGESLEAANEIAAALREIHEQGRAHGNVTAAHVSITENGSELQPATSWENKDTARDIRDFGSLLFEMLTGAPPKEGEMPVHSRLPGSRSGLAALRVATLQIAGNCFGEGSYQPSMQQVVTELRLLAVLLKIHENADSPAAPQPRAPFLVNHPAVPRRTAPPETPPVDSPVAEAADEEPVGAPVIPLGPTSFGQPSQRIQSDVATRGGACPKCDSSPVYVARPRTRFEAFLVRMNVPICRCHSCYFRYCVFLGAKIRKAMPAGAEGRRRPHRRHR